MVLDHIDLAFSLSVGLWLSEHGAHLFSPTQPVMVQQREWIV